MKLNLNTIMILGATAAITASCSRNPDSPGYEYVPDMYRSQAIEAYVDYGLVGDTEYGEVYDSLKSSMSAKKPPMGTIVYQSDETIAEIMMPYSTPDSDSGYVHAAENQIPAHYLQTEAMAVAYADEGMELYTNFCSHCHGGNGKGDGAVVTKKGYNAPAPYDGGLKDRTLGTIFHVITYGKGAMGPHGSQLNKDERWKLALAVRTMQHGELKYDELVKGRRIGSDEMVFGTIDLSKIVPGTHVSLRNTHFALDNAELSNDAKTELDSLAAYLNTNSDKIEISAHTDDSNDEESNIALSKERADAVVIYLVSKGVAEDRLIAVGRGSAEPIAYNTTEEGKFKNRRIEFVKL